MAFMCWAFACGFGVSSGFAISGADGAQPGGHAGVGVPSAFVKWPGGHAAALRCWLIHPHNFQQRYIASQVDG